MTNTAAHLRAPELATPRTDRSHRAVASGCAVLAGTIHALVAPEHLEAAWYVGGFFVSVAAGQLALALVLARGWPPAPRTTLWAVAANLVVVAVYVATRTIDLTFLPTEGHAREHLAVVGGVGNGIPILPGAHIEPVGLLDFVCLMAELILVAALVATLPGPTRRAVTNVMLALGVMALVARGAGLLT
ncbi:hypothetical protein [Phycicoccus sp. Root101]|uniref:hypothetical protein n=1 Tax=Phycicoccus sp. Root101 TaxID=1736421 RepID=UPI0007128214|nr:hypothetical protein [Phycicoccus sp. Root101]KQU67394.1 hypothetical protein ASC58_12500 [Phycicoccus sp. Root101]